MACHSAINPFGFAFENIDSIGRIRQFETAYSTEGIEIATHPIDTFVERLPLGLTSVQVAVKDGFELIDELAKSPDAHACFSKQLYRFYQKQSESDQDNCQLANVFDSLLTNGSEQKGSIADALVSLFSHESTIVRRVE